MIVGFHHSEKVEWKWLVNGKPIELDGKKYSVENDGNSSTLKINNIEKTDKGTYRCEATNSVGTSGYDYVLRVKSKTIVWPIFVIDA